MTVSMPASGIITTTLAPTIMFSAGGLFDLPAASSSTPSLPSPPQNTSYSTTSLPSPPQNTSSNGKSSNDGLSRKGAIGLGVGLGLGVTGILIGICFLPCVHRRYQSLINPGPRSDSEEVEMSSMGGDPRISRPVRTEGGPEYSSYIYLSRSRGEMLAREYERRVKI